MSSKNDQVFQGVEADFVSRVGSPKKSDGKCRHAKCLNRGVHSRTV
jgi:hypothetical protein